MSRRGRGQTLVLAALTALAVCVALLAVLHVGVAVRERIRLQDTADAAAYSAAALEARAFNFYAVANRTQASHYASAMLLQSLVSFAHSSEAFLTDVYGVMRTLDPCASEPRGLWAATCPALKRLPVLGPALTFLEGALALLEGLVASYQRTLAASGLDEQVGAEAIPLLRTMNSALAHVSTAVMEATLAHVRTGAAEVVAANDAELSAPDVKTSALSECLFDRAHVREANGSPLAPNRQPGSPLLPRARAEADRTTRAKRTMAQVANASRASCDDDRPDCPEHFATRRAAVHLPDWMAPVRGLLEAVPRWGTSRLLTHRLGRGTEDPEGGNYLREPADTPGAGMAMLAQGDVLGADDVYALNLGPSQLAGLQNPLACAVTDRPGACWGDPRHGLRADRPYRFLLESSVWAAGDDEPGIDRGGVHWRLSHLEGPRVRGWRRPSAPGALGALGLNEVRKRIAGAPLSVFVANVQPLMDGNHRWPGLAPFMHFEPGQFANACDGAGGRSGAPSLTRAGGREAQFNQPSAWVQLEHPPRSGPWQLNARRQLGISGQQLKLGGEVQGVRVAGTVIARAQAYYHRPGSWNEPPNFFNPYWRARLASVWQGRAEHPHVQALVDALPAVLREQPQKALVH